MSNPHPEKTYDLSNPEHITLSLAEVLDQIKTLKEPCRGLDAHLLCALHGYRMHDRSDPAKDQGFSLWQKYGERWVCHNCSSWPEITNSVQEVFDMLESVRDQINAFEMSMMAGLEAYQCRINYTTAAHRLPQLAILIALLTQILDGQIDYRGEDHD
jgi:hypothetical protein